MFLFLPAALLRSVQRPGKTSASETKSGAPFWEKSLAVYAAEFLGFCGNHAH